MIPAYKHRTHSRPQATSGSGSATRRDPAAQAGRAPQSAESFLIFPISREGKSTKIKKEKRDPQVAQSLERPSCRTVFSFCLFGLKPGLYTGFQGGISPSADGDSGLCPKNPQPFEKGWRKLQFCRFFELSALSKKQTYGLNLHDNRQDHRAALCFLKQIVAQRTLECTLNTIPITHTLV